MKKTIIYLIVALMSGLGTVSCDDTQDYRVDLSSGSTLKVSGDLKTSYFTLSNALFMAPESVQAVITTLMPVDGGTSGITRRCAPCATATWSVASPSLRVRIYPTGSIS